MNEAQKSALVEEFMEEVAEAADEMSDGILPLEDLIQEGYVGLMQGIRLLERGEAEEMELSVTDTLRGSIRQAIREAIELQKGRLRQDDRLVVQVELLNRSIERLTEELGTKPNVDEIANDMRISQQEVLNILRLTGEGISDEEFLPPPSSGKAELS